jgi:hypothetical protein
MAERVGELPLPHHALAIEIRTQRFERTSGRCGERRNGVAGATKVARE